MFKGDSGGAKGGRSWNKRREGLGEGAGKEMLCDKWPALLPEP